ncbi:hypothetical protein BK138_16115 [Paenibacillus rhizosphaerae]|uniref:Uncharacterized protein n=1 Tax=Paenibacillus rhizosphaerae TaxID=297318 RepID=A0A1R1ESH5_9BACL|nr:hypothetical protein BK138_16115 [Paenibacillus rhizosphaerae]
MRLRERDKRPVTFKKRITVKEPDGTTYEDWDPIGETIRANVQPAGGRVMAEMYGERLAYMLTAYVEPGTTIPEASFVCVYTNPTPDYKVVAVRPWNGHRVIDLEKVKP